MICMHVTRATRREGRERTLALQLDSIQARRAHRSHHHRHRLGALREAQSADSLVEIVALSAQCYEDGCRTIATERLLQQPRQLRIAVWDVAGGTHRRAAARREAVWRAQARREERAAAQGA